VTEHKVKIAEWAVALAPAMIVTIGLGSCVAIVLHDATARVGGMAHVLLPAPAQAHDGDRPGKCPSTAVPRLLEEMRALGARGPITARLVGGASLFGPLLAGKGLGSMGERNVAASRHALAAARVRVVGELVGGDVGRSVYFDVASGRVDVRSVRDGDRVL
jgi:chemotaxis protein CheD